MIVDMINQQKDLSIMDLSIKRSRSKMSKGLSVFLCMLKVDEDSL